MGKVGWGLEWADPCLPRDGAAVLDLKGGRRGRRRPSDRGDSARGGRRGGVLTLVRRAVVGAAAGLL